MAGDKGWTSSNLRSRGMENASDVEKYYKPDPAKLRLSLTKTEHQLRVKCGLLKLTVFESGHASATLFDHGRHSP